MASRPVSSSLTNPSACSCRKKGKGNTQSYLVLLLPWSRHRCLTFASFQGSSASPRSTMTCSSTLLSNNNNPTSADSRSRNVCCRCASNTSISRLRTSRAMSPWQDASVRVWRGRHTDGCEFGWYKYRDILYNVSYIWVFFTNKL
jgi:hypothetical protein